MEKEKVIFRREYNRYRKEWQFVAVFPETESNPGRISSVSFWFDIGGVAWFEPFCEIDRNYYLNKTRIIHKKDLIVEKLLSAIENYYDQQFKVVEKIMY